jgi:Tol biopolymer transport system component
LRWASSPGINVTHFAFSPDSQRLALFGSDGRRSGGRLYVMDLQTGRPARLLDLQDAKSFVWSPDGQFLALIGRSNDPQFNESVMVVRIADGKVTYTRSIDFESGNGSSDWPTLDWGVDFPVEMSTLKDCAAPPLAADPVE